MGAALEIKRRSRRMMVPTFGALFLLYFLAHAFYGDRGLFAWAHLQKEITTAQDTLADIRATKTQMEKRIALLRSGHLDPDMLDERTRIMTGLVRPDEVVLVDPYGKDAKTVASAK